MINVFYGNNKINAFQIRVFVTFKFNMEAVLRSKMSTNISIYAQILVLVTLKLYQKQKLFKIIYGKWLCG